MTYPVPLHPSSAVSVIVPSDLVVTLAPQMADAAPGARTVGIDADGVINGDASDAIALLRYFPTIATRAPSAQAR